MVFSLNTCKEKEAREFAPWQPEKRPTPQAFHYYEKRSAFYSGALHPGVGAFNAGSTEK